LDTESIKTEIREDFPAQTESPKPVFRVSEASPMKSVSASPASVKSPPPAPPQSRTDVLSRADKLDDDDDDDEILTVDADGQVEIHSTSRMSNRSYTIEEKISVNEAETNNYNFFAVLLSPVLNGFGQQLLCLPCTVH